MNFALRKHFQESAEVAERAFGLAPGVNPGLVLRALALETSRQRTPCASILHTQSGAATRTPHELQIRTSEVLDGAANPTTDAAVRVGQGWPSAEGDAGAGQIGTTGDRVL